MWIKWFNLIWYETRASSPMTIWLFPLLVIISSLLMALVDTQADDLMRFEYVAMVTEILFPLALMFVATGLILDEREKNTLVFVGVRSSLITIWLRRLNTLLVWSILWFGILMLIYHLFYFPLSFAKMLLSFLAVSLALISIASAAALIFREVNAGYLTGTFLWGMCLIAPRFSFDFFGPRFYLFYLWFNVTEGLELDSWLQNRVSLILVSFTLIFTTMLLLRSRDRMFI